MIEKYGEKMKELCVAFMGAGKPHDRVRRMPLWKVLYKYGVDHYIARK